MHNIMTGSRVERIGTSWGNIFVGMKGTVTEVLENGKKLRVFFDDYSSNRTDGTVIILTNTMVLTNKRPMTDPTTDPALRVNTKGSANPYYAPFFAENKVRVDEKAPIRDFPFGRIPGVKTGVRVSVEPPHSLSLSDLTGFCGMKPIMSTVEVIDITVPLRPGYEPRGLDINNMRNYDPTEGIEGFIGEDLGYEKQEKAAERFERLKFHRPLAERTLRAQMRPMMPYTVFEKNLHVRRFNALETHFDKDSGEYVRRGDAIARVLLLTLRPPESLNK